MKSSLLTVFYMHMKHQNEKRQQLQNTRLQQMFKVPASGPNTRPQPSTPLVNHIASDHLLRVCPAVNEASPQLVDVWNALGWGLDCWEATDRVL